jgi:hypothetical protein
MAVLRVVLRAEQRVVQWVVRMGRKMVDQLVE